MATLQLDADHQPPTTHHRHTDTRGFYQDASQSSQGPQRHKLAKPQVPSANRGNNNAQVWPPLPSTELQDDSATSDTQ